MVEVTIKGAGIIGLSIAWECIQRGAKVQVIDPNGIGAGSSGGIVGALAPHVPENWNEKKAFQFESLVMAQSFWDDVDHVSGLNSGYARTGRVQPLLDNAGLSLAHERGENAKSLWQGVAEWRVVDDQPEWAPPSPTGRWIYDTLSARIHPRHAVASIAEAIQKSGGQISHSAEDAGKVVWAAGAWDLMRISEHIGKNFGNGVKGQAALFEYDQRLQPQIFADTMHFIPHADGTLAVGSTSERTYENPTTTDANLDDIIDKAVNILPDLKNSKVIARWAGVRPRSKSRAPVLGFHPMVASEYIANGGFKIGFGMAPKIAQVMANLILEDRDDIPNGFRVEKSL
jgi:glycine oxidase